MIHPLLSIIIPVYNTEEYLAECINSILEQTYNDWELILVDDGSTDNSGVICDDFAQRDSRIKVLHTENGGASHARNAGIEHATGKWISFVDSDDWISSDYVDTIANTNEDYDIIYFNLVKKFSNGFENYLHTPSLISKDRKGTEEILFQLKYGPLGDIFGWTCAKFYKSSIIKENKIRFVEELTFREDEIFTMQYCIHINSIKLIDKYLYYYRIRNNGLTANGRLSKKHLILSQHLIKLLPFYNNPELLENDKHRIIDYQIFYFLYILRIKNSFHETKKIHNLLNSDTIYIKTASNKHIVKLLSHSLFTSYILIMIDMILQRIKNLLS